MSNIKLYVIGSASKLQILILVCGCPQSPERVYPQDVQFLFSDAFIPAERVSRDDLTCSCIRSCNDHIDGTYTSLGYTCSCVRLSSKRLPCGLARLRPHPFFGTNISSGRIRPLDALIHGYVHHRNAFTLGTHLSLGLVCLHD